MIIKTFLKNLSERLYDENSLSDITYAYAKADPEFFEIFMGMFNTFSFKKDEKLEIRREVSNDGARPDFVIEQGEQKYIIENKIYDKNTHFKQYKKRYDDPDYQRGLIANYDDHEIAKEAKNNGFSYVSWQDFAKKLDHEYVKKKAAPVDERGIMLQAYIEYVREVCGIMEIKKISFANLSSLYHFNMLIEHIIHSSVRGYDCRVDKQKKSFWEDCSGRYFGLKRKDSRHKVSPWFGVWYGEDPPIISIIFEKHLCRKLHNNYKLTKRDGDYFKKPYEDQDNYGAWEFELKNEQMQAFLKASQNGQKDILKKFFTEVIQKVGRHL